ncbi:MAG: transcription-repair coupling factor, partial [Desulfobacterales bacterium]
MTQNQVINSLEALAAQILRRTGPIECFGLNGSEKALLITRLYDQLRIPIFVVAPTTQSAETLLADLRYFKRTDDGPLFLFPSYNILPFKLMAYHNETAARRIRTLYHMLESPTAPIIVAPAETLLQKVVPKQEIINYAELLMAGEEIDRERLIEKLMAGGYTHAAIVEEPGDFCVRGGILDIYCPLYPDPVRIEFFGDIAESIRYFSAASQRTIQSISEAV